MKRLESYLRYHSDSSRAMDIDIQVEAIQFLRRMFSLNAEHVVWLSFLFSTTYCMATAWYIFRHAPTYDYLTAGMLEEFWRRERPGLLFQTDMRWTRSANQWVRQVESYQKFVRSHGRNQIEAFTSFFGSATPGERYNLLERSFGVHRFGRFSAFLFGELLGLAGFAIEPEFHLRDMRSVYNGIVFVEGSEGTDYIGGDRHGRRATDSEIARAEVALKELVERARKLNVYPRHRSLWSIETTLCAYKKWHLGKRYVGYYVERAIKEVVKMKKMHPDFNWTPLVRFAERYYPQQTRRIVYGH